MSNKGGAPTPRSVEDVEQLVKQLYKPGDSREIVRIQEELQQLQRSTEGWRLADALLSSNDATVRFFGALTFQVKLNNDGSSLDNENAHTVLQRILHWLVFVNKQQDGALVQKKLCSALSTWFLRSPVTWQNPILHIALSLHRGEAVPEPDALRKGASLDQVLADLASQQLTALLWFASTLADDLGRLDNVYQGNIRYHAQMERIVPSAGALMTRAFQHGAPDVGVESLKCFLTWVNYAQPMWTAKPEVLEHLQGLIPHALSCLLVPDLEREALDVFRDLLETYTSFFRPQHMQSIASLIQKHFAPKLFQCLQDKDADGILMGQLVIAYSCAALHDLVMQPQLESSQVALQLQLAILQSPGWPGDDDDLSILAIEFWNTYIEYVTDSFFSSEGDDPKPHWVEHARQVLTQGSELVWTKMWLPPPEIAKEWTDTERGAFKEFRMDASDLLASIYVFLGRPMAEQIAAFMLRSLEAKQWRPVEAGMCCLSALADNILDDATADDVLASIFGSSLFRDMANFDHPINAQTRKTAIDMLGNYGGYIERHPEFLPDTLRYLFASLETAALANVSARSISSLCFTCRHSLTGELDSFLQQYQHFMAGPTNDAYNQEKVMGAIAAIIQALSPESAKAGPLNALLENVEKQIANAKQYMAQGDKQMAELVGIGALSSLASIGRASQVPDDFPINLDDDETQPPGTYNFWESSDGRAIQQRITGCFSILDILSYSGDAIDAACQVLRSGYTEVVPGPFVMPASTTVDFLRQCTISTPRVESVLSTAAILISQHSSSNAKRIDQEVRTILTQVLVFMAALGQPGEDPSIGQQCIEMCARLLPFYANILFACSAEQLKLVLDFSLTAMSNADPLPKSSASDFWTKLLKLLGPQSNVEAHDVRSQTEQVIAAYGPRLSESLMVQISGRGFRSDLDALCQVLKALVFYVPQSKEWLHSALFSDVIKLDNGSITEVDKKRFLQQVVGLRGDKKTREVVKQFFIACRGTVSFGN